MPRDRRHRKRVTVYRAEVPDSGDLWEVEYEAIADALHFACRDLREGRRRPIEITQDGVQIYDAAAITRECEHRVASTKNLTEGHDSEKRSSGTGHTRPVRPSLPARSRSC